MPKPDDHDDEAARRNANIVALIVVAAVILLAVLALHFLSANLQTERCLEERRHGCGDDAAP
ncbi:MAG TPA: hypothetical protein VNU97_12675 [Rhizomicrobium sp.]|jgi:hypothetical protein|nr:hypothetical protein [Rhizomicrobium sp.]